MGICKEIKYQLPDLQISFPHGFLFPLSHLRQFQLTVGSQLYSPSTSWISISHMKHSKGHDGDMLVLSSAQSRKRQQFTMNVWNSYVRYGSYYQYIICTLRRLFHDFWSDSVLWMMSKLVQPIKTPTRRTPPQPSELLGQLLAFVVQLLMWWLELVLVDQSWLTLQHQRLQIP